MRIALMFALVAGCGIDLPDELETSSVQQKMCPKFGCGNENSPWINGAYFHDLDKLGSANLEGFSLVGFYDAKNQPYTLDVRHGRLSGSSPNGPIAGKQLVGARMVVKYLGVEYAIRIDDVATVPYWATTTQRPMPVLEAYKLNYYELTHPERIGPLCKNAKAESPDNLSMTDALAFYTLLFEVDRIDAVRKDVTVDTANRWFNLGCAGGAPAKMYLAGHTFAATMDGFTTSVDDRKTFLKMVTGDYCGDGVAYTAAGQPLTWADDRQTMHLSADATTLDGRWGPNGAICVGKPRASVKGTPAALDPELSWITSPGAITSACAQRNRNVPMCTNMTLTLGGAHIISANRPL